MKSTKVQCNWVWAGSSPDPLTQQAIELIKLLPEESQLREQVAQRAARHWLAAIPEPATLSTTTTTAYKLPIKKKTK